MPPAAHDITPQDHDDQRPTASLARGREAKSLDEPRGEEILRLHECRATMARTLAAARGEVELLLGKRVAAAAAGAPVEKLAVFDEMLATRRYFVDVVRQELRDTERDLTEVRAGRVPPRPRPRRMNQVIRRGSMRAHAKLGRYMIRRRRSVAVARPEPRSGYGGRPRAHSRRSAARRVTATRAGPDDGAGGDEPGGARQPHTTRTEDSHSVSRRPRAATSERRWRP